ncbi:MAG: hypothetical protein R3277_05490 [Brumimicrobium sp.]|nr:hypothetical protein [Brumimicrobium sp.]
MKTIKKIILTLTVGALVSSCANYSAISDNDVYLQKPPLVDLAEGGEGVTSYNYFKAEKQGLYQTADRRTVNNNIFIMGMGSPMFFHPYHGYGDPFWSARMYGGYYPFYNSYFYDPFNMYTLGFGHNSWYGTNPYWGYGYGMGFGPYTYNSHYANSFQGVYFIGPAANYPGYPNPIQPNNSFFGSSSINQIYGHRGSVGSSSRRSSSYPSTTKSMNLPNDSQVNKTPVNARRTDIGSQQVVNRREVSNNEYINNRTSGVRVNNYPNVNRREIGTTGRQDISVNRNTNYSSSNRRTTYTPSQTARRSGTVTRSTSPSYGNSGGTVNRRGGAEYNTNYNSRGNTFSQPANTGGGVTRSGGTTRPTGGSGNSGRR